jgi:hypothetical protein
MFSHLIYLKKKKKTKTQTIPKRRNGNLENRPAEEGAPETLPGLRFHERYS